MEPRGAVKMDEKKLSPKLEYAILGCILLVGFVLRFSWLGTPSYWLDEIFQIHSALAPTLSESMSHVPLNKPHLFYVLQFFVARISLNEWVFRIPSCLIGAASIWVIWGLARTACKEQWVALFAACLLATSPLHIQYSQEARPYALSLFSAMAGVWGMFAALQRPSRPRLFFTALFPALSGWTLYFGMGVLALQIVWLAGLLVASEKISSSSLAIYDKSAVKLTLGTLLGVAFLLLILLVFRLASIPDLKPVYTEGAPVITATLFLEMIAWLAFDRSWPIVFAIISFAVLGAIHGWTHFRSSTCFFLLWLLLLPSAQTAAYYWADHWIASRYYVIHVPPMLILAAVGFSCCLNLAALNLSHGCDGDCPKNYGPRILGRRFGTVPRATRVIPQSLDAFTVKKKTAVLLLAMALLILSYAAQEPVKRWRAQKPNLREVAHRLAETASEGDIAIGSGLETKSPYNFYRLQRWPKAPPLCELDNLPEALCSLKAAKKIWLIYQESSLKDKTDLLLHLDPSLPASPPSEPIVHVIDRPALLYESLMKSAKLHPRLKTMELRIPVLLKMGAQSVEPLLDRRWSRPRRWRGEWVRGIRGDECALVFRVVGAPPDSITVRVVPLSGKGAYRHDFLIVWNGTVLLHVSNLDGGRINPLAARIPASVLSDDFQALRLTCASAADEEPANLPDKTLRPSLAIASIEIR
jgi:hypothetical protein